MRVLIDVKLLGKGGTTGVSGYAKEVVSGLLSGTKHEYRLFYNGYSMNPLPQEWLSNPKVSVLNWHIPNKLFHLTTRLFNFPSLAKQKNIDLVFSPHFHILPSGDIPRVVTFHDLSFIHYPQFFSPKQRVWHWWQNYATQARQATHIVAVSEYTKADLVNILKIPPEKITVIYSGIGKEFKKISQDDPVLLQYKLKQNLHKPFFLFVGTLEPRKNIPTLIKAFALLKQNPQFKNFELIIVGRPGYKASEVYAEVNRSGCAEDIRFLNNVSDEQRPILYNLSHAFVFPTFFEGFGFPPLEAQACGTPVVASDRTSLPEILGDTALYFNPWKTAELAQQMERVATDPKLRQTLIQQGLANAKKFTWQKAAKQLDEVFRHSDPPNGGEESKV